MTLDSRTLARTSIPMRVLQEIPKAITGAAVGLLIVAALSLHMFGYRILTVQSNSMEPLLTRGDLAITRPAAVTDVDVGEVVLFEDGQSIRFLTLHRVVGVINLTTNIHNTTTGEVSAEHSRLLRTQGDANPSPDSMPVGADRLRGVLWFTVPRIGFVMDEVPLQTVLLGIAALTGALWAAYELLHRRARRTA